MGTGSLSWPLPPRTTLANTGFGAAQPRARRSGSRLPTVVTAAVVALVLAVVAVATGVAYRADTRVPAAAARPRPAITPALAASADGGIDFTSNRGSGRLVVIRHTWRDQSAVDRSRSGVAGADGFLSVEVEIRCTAGLVDYEPGYFSLFDPRGRLVESRPDPTGPNALGLGTLGPGERVRGVLWFQLSRADATLVLSDDFGSVTAVKVSG